MIRDATIWGEVVQIDTDIAEVCRQIDQGGDLQKLGRMLDELMERKRALLAGAPPPLWHQI